MLTELRLDGERLGYAVLGLGVNVNVNFRPGHRLDLDRLCRRVADTAISLSMALGHTMGRLVLLAAILAGCETWYERKLAGITARSLGRPAGHGGPPGDGDDCRRRGGGPRCRRDPRRRAAGV